MSDTATALAPALCFASIAVISIVAVRLANEMRREYREQRKR